MIIYMLNGVYMVSHANIIEARERIASVIHRTSVLPSRTFSEMSGNEIFLKPENLQKTGSFKLRGAYNRISTLTQEEKSKGVIASSAGNHAQGVAYSAAAHGVKATIVMPQRAPVAKVMATQSYGARVVLHGAVYDEAYRKAREIQDAEGFTFLHPFNDPMVIAGQGTIAMEMLEDLPELDAIVIPIGGGGLVAGMAIAAKAIKPSIRIIGVEVERFDAMRQSVMDGDIITVKSGSTIADGIAVKKPGDLTFDIIRRYVDDIVTVNEEETAEAILLLLERAKWLVEGAGAVSVAAAVERKLGMSGKKVGLVLSGGNIDINVLSTIIEKGLIQAGRKLRIQTILQDKPGQLAQVMDVLAGLGANIRSIHHDRYGEEVELGYVQVAMDTETRNRDHAEDVMKALKQQGFIVKEA